MEPEPGSPPPSETPPAHVAIAAAAPPLDARTRLLGVGTAYAVGALFHVVFTGAAGQAAGRAFAGAWWVAWAAGGAWLAAYVFGGAGAWLDGARLRQSLGFALGAAVTGLSSWMLTPHAAHVALPMAGLLLALPASTVLGALPGSVERALAHRLVPWVAGAGISGWYFLVSYLRHAWFGSGSKDMGLFLQSVWLVSRLKSPENTIMGMNAFGDHMELIDFAFAPLLWAWPDAGALLLGQAAAAGLGAVPLFRMASARLGGPVAGLLCALAYFLSFEITHGVQFDWNPTTVSLGLFPWALEAALDRRWRRMGVFLLLIGLCKENLLLYVAGFGIFLAVTGAPPRVWATVVGASALAFVVEIKVLFPMFREAGFRHFYFQDLGTDLAGVAVNVVLSPARAFATLFTPGQKVNGLLLPLSSTAFGVLFAPAMLLPMLPGMLERFGSTFQNSWWGHHYGGPSHALALCGAVIGLARVRTWLLAWVGGDAAPELARRAAGLLPAALVLAATCLVSFNGPWGPIDLFVLRKPYHPSDADRATMRAAVASIPDDVPVAAQNYMLPHVAARPRAFMLERAAEAEFVAMTPTTNPWPYDRGYHERLAQQLLASGWRVHFCQGNSFVLARNPGESVPCPVLGR